MGVTSLLTSLMAVVAPASALKRQYALNTLESVKNSDSIRTYDAAKPNRFNKNKKLTDGNANQELLSGGDLIKMRKVARYLNMNSPVARSAVRAFTATTVGKHIIIQSKATDKDGKPLTEYNKAVNRYWKIWSSRCDIRGKKSFVDFIRQATDSYMTSGEYFIEKLYRQDDPICGLRLSSLDPDNVDAALNTDKIIGGIEFDTDWKALRYHLTTKDVSTKKALAKTTIDAVNMIHSFIEDRPGQSRGEPAMAPAINFLWAIHRAFEAELASLEIQACLSVIYKSGTGLVGGRSAITGAGANTVSEAGITQKLGAGTIIGIPNADEIKIVDPARPGNSFAPFIDKAVEMIASSMNLSYAKVNKDYSKGNFSSQRMGEQDVRRQCGIIQSRLEADIINNVWASFVEDLVIRGLVKAPGFKELKDFYLQKEVTFQPHEYIQPLQDAQADAIKLSSKIYRMDELIDGQDAEEHVDALASLNDYAAKKGIPIYPADQRVVNVGGAILSNAGETNEMGM